VKAVLLPAAALLVSAGLAGCERHAHTSAAPHPVSGTPALQDKAAANPGIAWFAGSLEAAFARARAEHKPVFLYWGASWCPPCHELRATVFSRPDFIEKSKLFIPVHLDGDDPGAQKWGEVFHVLGYPTVLILRDEHTELERISGGIDMSQYGAVLDLALGDVRPVQELLASVSAPTAALSADDCRRLAYYAWDDPGEGTDTTRLSQSLSEAVERCPSQSSIERMRLTIAATAAQVDAEQAALKAGKPPSAYLSMLLARVYALLADPARAVRAADVLESLGDAFFAAARRASGIDAAELLRRWESVMDAAAADARYSDADRLDALESKLRAVKALSPGRTIPAGLAASAERRIDAVLAQAHDEHARASAVNSALNILEVLGDDAKADAILHQQLALSKSPYYYMPDIAELEEKRGHKEAAIEWLARGYHESQGAATRFQWGTQYVLGLVRLAPADEARIRGAGLEVLGELSGPDRIYARTRRLLLKLDTSLRKWNEHGEHETTISALRDKLHGVCADIPSADPARKSCSGFLAKA